MEHELEIAEIVGALASSFVNAKVPGQTQRIYIRMLSDLPVDVLRTAAEQCLVECEFFPTIAAIRDRALKLMAPQHAEPMEAWGIVQRAITTYGFYRSPVFDDPVIAKAVDCIGWQTMCSSENQVADRAHFAKVYEQMILRETQEARLLPAARQLRQQLRESPVREIGNGRAF